MKTLACFALLFTTFATPPARGEAVVLPDGVDIDIDKANRMLRHVESRVRRLETAAASAGWTDVETAKLRKLLRADAARAYAEKGEKRAKRLAAAPKIDKDVEKLRKTAKDRAARFAVLKRTQTAYEPGRTNLAVRAMKASLKEKLDEARQGWTNALRRVASVEERLLVRREEYVAKRDSATLPTTKALCQGFIDIIDNLLSLVEAKKEED